MAEDSSRMAGDFVFGELAVSRETGEVVMALGIDPTSRKVVFAVINTAELLVTACEDKMGLAKYLKGCHEKAAGEVLVPLEEGPQPRQRPHERRM